MKADLSFVGAGLPVSGNNTALVNQSPGKITNKEN